MFHRRIVVLNFKPENLPKFKSNAEQNAYHAAIGRMVTYVIERDDAQDSIQLVTGAIEKGEVCCHFYCSVPEYPEKWPDGSTKCLGSNSVLLTDTLQSLSMKAQDKGRGFTMAAIDRGNEWSFHS